MPLYLAGQKIRGSEINSLPQTYFVQSDQIINSNTNLIACVGLSFAAEANVRYFVECLLGYLSTAAADIKLGFAGPAGMTGWWTANGLNTGAAAGVGNLDAVVVENYVALHARAGADPSPVLATPAAYMKLAAALGTVQLMFAQNSAVNFNTKILAGSVMRVTRLG